MATVGPAPGISGVRTPIGSAPRPDRVVAPVSAPGLAGRETAPGTSAPAPGADTSNTAFLAQLFVQENDAGPPQDHLASFRVGHSAYRAAQAIANSATADRAADAVFGPRNILDLVV